MKALGENLKRLRLAAGMTQEQLAAAARISRNSMLALEAQRSAPRVSTLLRLAEALRVSVGALLEGEISRIHEPAAEDEMVSTVEIVEKAEARLRDQAERIKALREALSAIADCYSPDPWAPLSYVKDGIGAAEMAFDALAEDDEAIKKGETNGDDGSVSKTK